MSNSTIDAEERDGRSSSKTYRVKTTVTTRTVAACYEARKALNLVNLGLIITIMGITSGSGGPD